MKSGNNNPNWKGGLSECFCLHCQSAIMVKPSAIRRERGKFCSRKCKGSWSAKNRKGFGSNRVDKTCRICGAIKQVKKSHSEKSGTYCSFACMAKGYASRLVGSSNPNWKGGNVKKRCVQCGKDFEALPCNRYIRKFCSSSCAGTFRTINQKDSANHSTKRSKAGRREDLGGVYFRSSWEANWARYLDWMKEKKQIITWYFEPFAFEFEGIKRGSRFYVPDFRVVNADESIEYHEIKGYMDKRSATKLKRMAKYHPNVKVVLVDKSAYESMLKRIGPFLSGLEVPTRAPGKKR